MGTKVGSNQAERGTRKGSPNHPIDLKRGLAKAACEPGVSVSKLAREHGINANLLFKWRRQLVAGLLGSDTAQSPVLLEVRPSTQTEATPERGMTVAAPDQMLPANDSCLEIELAGATLRCFGAIDLGIVRTILGILKARA